MVERKNIMTRGTIYELEKDIHNVGKKTKYDFSNYEGDCFDYVTEVESLEQETNCLINYFNWLGMKTGTIVILDEMKRVPYVDITEEGRKAYFKGRYEKFMQLTGQLTLEDFSSDAGKALELRILINNSCCDAVTNEINRFDGFDDFMRTASGRYYIGNVFYMK